MKRLLILMLVGLGCGQYLSAQPLAFTNITGYITTPPQINAISVLNSGYWYIGTYPWPFDMSNNRNFTNVGSMYGAVGFRFDNAPTGTGTRRMAANFHNKGANASITADSASATYSGPYYTYQGLTPAYLLISATNIINEGLLAVGANGMMELTGSNINLRYSRLQVIPNQGIINGSVNYTNRFDPDAGIYDNYWNVLTNMSFNSAALYEFDDFGNVTAQAPTHWIARWGGVSDLTSFTVGSAVYSCYEAVVGAMNLIVTNEDTSLSLVYLPTNVVRQAAFVSTIGPRVSAQIRFFPSSNETNYMQTVAVELSALLTNITGGASVATVYFVDTLASETNRGPLPNSTGTLTARPANYLVQRSAPIEYVLGLPGNAPLLDEYFLYDPSFTNQVVSGEYAAYSAFIDNLVSRPGGVPGAALTNMPGRIIINANSLDLTKTRIRGEGLVTVQTPHLISSSGAIVDSENLNYTLGSTNGNLTVRDLVKPTVERLRGDIQAWSALWSNSATVVITNYAIDTNAPSGVVPAFLTNTIQFQLHALLLSASALQIAVPVYVFNFITRSTNVVINDSMIVTNRLLIDGLSFTLNGRLTLHTGARNWDASAAPHLRYFTNAGTLWVENDALFGFDRALPYAAFVNRGTIDAFSQRINSDYAELTGLNAASYLLHLSTRSGKIDGGRLRSGYDMLLEGGTLKLNNANITVGAHLDLAFTNSLFDVAGATTNTITCYSGFSLNRKPQTGDLLGTTLASVAPNYPVVWLDHAWAAQDRGASAAGYSNNVAIGRLVLSSRSSDPLFYFRGVGAQNALYVDMLDIAALGRNYAYWMEIDPNLKIYYAAARLGFTPPPHPNGQTQLPEEYLDGQFGGRLRWVPDYAGLNSSVAVVVDGRTVYMNRALRNSRVIDSDGDGLPNYYDPTPLGGLSLTASLVPVTNTFALQGFWKSGQQQMLALSWFARSNSIYRVEYTTNMPLSNWALLMNFTNSVSSNRWVTVYDITAPAGAPQRFYRVIQLK